MIKRSAQFPVEVRMSDNEFNRSMASRQSWIGTFRRHKASCVLPRVGTPGSAVLPTADHTFHPAWFKGNLRNLLPWVFCADRECPIFAKLRGIIRKTFGLSQVLQNGLGVLGSKVRATFIFGSMATGIETRDSDLDVVIVGDQVSLHDFVKALTDAQRELGREEIFSLFADNRVTWRYGLRTIFPNIWPPLFSPLQVPAYWSR